MLQKTFSYYSDTLEDVDLFVEVGKNHIACWCKQTGNKQLRAFEFFLCDDHTEATFAALIKDMRSHSRLISIQSNKLNFFWNNTEVLCLPPSHENNDDIIQAGIELMFGNSDNTRIFSASTRYCVVAWRIKQRQQQDAETLFNNAVFGHSYTYLLSFTQEENTVCYLFFYPNHFTVILYNTGKLQLAQTRKYKTAEDVLYFVLNVFKQYNVQQNADVVCSGFINENSKLYELLYQYLENLKLMHVDEAVFNDKASGDYSQHYFLPYINYNV
jgi:hypothetical protein